LYRNPAQEGKIAYSAFRAAMLHVSVLKATPRRMPRSFYERLLFRMFRKASHTSPMTRSIQVYLLRRTPMLESESMIPEK
jgi:hypothetical protein